MGPRSETKRVSLSMCIDGTIRSSLSTRFVPDAKVDGM